MMLFKNVTLLFAFAVLSGMALAIPQGGDNTFPLLTGKSTPLTLKLKDLDSNWRVFNATSNPYENILASAMGGGSNQVFTKGDTVTVGSEVFLIAYKPDAPDMSSIFQGGRPAKPKPMTENTILRLSLLNLHALSAMDGIKVFDLKQEVAANAIPATPLVTGGGENASTPEEPPLLKNGSYAPDFTVQDDKGHPVKLSAYRGKVVVVDFWATWCGPCQQSLPATNSVAAKYATKKVVFLGVNVWDTKKAFHDWLPDHKKFSSIRFAIDTHGTGKDVATKLYHVSGIPTQYVIDRKGRVVKSLVGYSGNESDLTTGIKQALSRS